ncbi:MAG: hypothetical protein QM831_39360 [Kofleriaceae bacterium]
MRAGLALLMASAIVYAEPVDPKRLTSLSTAKGTGEPTAVYAAGVDPDVLLEALGTTDFAVVAGGSPVDGKLGDQAAVTASAAFDAIAPASTVRLQRTRGAHAVDLDLHARPPLDVIRYLADSVSASYVFAPQHPLPPITVLARHVDPHATAKVVAQLAGLDLVEINHVWIVVEPHLPLDPKLAAKIQAKTRIEIDHSHPGEARRLLEPEVSQDRNACPKDTWIDASLHDEVGALEAVLAALPGPACEQHPSYDELDSATAQLLGIYIAPKVRRAVFRVPHGARAFEPTRGDQRVEVSYVVVNHGDQSKLPAIASAPEAPGPFDTDDREAWQLRGTIRIGTTWRAIFRSRSDWRVINAPSARTESPVEITAGNARSTFAGKPRSYFLER